MSKTPLPPRPLFAPASSAVTINDLARKGVRRKELVPREERGNPDAPQPATARPKPTKAALEAEVADIAGKTVPVRMRITPALAARIDAAATAENVTRSEMIRRALEERF